MRARIVTQPDIRPLAAGDLPGLKRVIDAVGLFPSDLLDDMAAPFLAGVAEEIWCVLAEAGQILGVAYCVPERMTQGTWNLLLMAVRPDRQGHGLGRRLTLALERQLAARGARLLLVETSGLDGFAPTRAVYRRLGFTEEARIRDFYAAGEDKLVFRKLLAPGAG